MTEVDFEVKGRSDPFVGGGSFVATTGESGTAITLEFGAEGKEVPFQNAGKQANGIVDINRAMAVSSDVFFYQLGDQAKHIALRAASIREFLGLAYYKEKRLPVVVRRVRPTTRYPFSSNSSAR